MENVGDIGSSRISADPKHSIRVETTRSGQPRKKQRVEGQMVINTTGASPFK